MAENSTEAPLEQPQKWSEECSKWKGAYRFEYTTVMTLTFFVLFAVWLIRILTIYTKIPHPILLFTLGVLIRLFAAIPENPWAKSILEIVQNISDDASSILHVFIALFLFGASAALSTHIFLRIIRQCLTLSLFGLIFGGALMTIFGTFVFSSYNWSWKIALLYAAIFQTIDPVAIPEAVKGPKEETIHIGTLLGGEALIHGAIYTSLVDYIVHLTDMDCWWLEAGFNFGKATFLAAVVGIVVSKILVVCSSVINNDQVAGVTVPFSVCYIAFIIAERLNVSGPLAVVMACIVINSERRGYNADLSKVIRSVWIMLAFLADTLIFVVSGIIVTHYHLVYSKRLIDVYDYFRSFVTYLLIIVTRTITITCVTPILHKFGLQITWKEGVVLVWGAAKGGLTLFMALLVRNQLSGESHNILESQRLLHHANIVIILSLLMHVLFLDKVLTVIGFKTISPNHLAAMANAVNHLKETIAKSINVQRMDNFLASANLQWIKKNTSLENPYDTKENQLSLVQYYQMQYHTCTRCDFKMIIPPNEQQRKDIMKDLFERALKAVQVSYWRQYEKRLVQKNVATKLISLAERAADKREGYLEAEDIKKCMRVNEFYTVLVKRLSDYQKDIEAFVVEPIKRERVNRIVNTARNIIYSRYYERIFQTVIGISIIVCLTSAIINIVKWNRNSKKYQVYDEINRYNCIFQIVALVIDIICRCISVGVKKFFLSFINTISSLVLWIQVINVCISFTVPFGRKQALISSISIFLVIRVTVFVSLIIRSIRRLIKRFQNMALYSSFEVGHCFLTGEQEIRKKLDYMAQCVPVTEELKERMSKNYHTIRNELVTMQQSYPKIVIAARTRLATREVLNDGIQALKNLKNEGALYDTEYYRLHKELQRCFDKLVGIPPSFILRLRPVDILKAVEWLDGDEQIEYFQNIEGATEEHYLPGTYVHTKDSISSTVFIIMYGIVKVTGKGHTQLFSDHLPNTDSNFYFQTDEYFEDYLSNCQSLGLLGMLNGGPCVTDSICDTEVRGYSIPFKNMKEAMATFNQSPSLEYQIWKMLALEIALPILLSQPHWKGYLPERLRIKLGNALLPDLYDKVSFTLLKPIQDVVLIQGRAKNGTTGEEYRGPVYIQRSIKSLSFPGNPSERGRPILLLLVSEGYALPDEYDWSGRNKELSLRKKYCTYHRMRFKSGKDTKPSKKYGFWS